MNDLQKDTSPSIDYPQIKQGLPGASKTFIPPVLDISDKTVDSFSKITIPKTIMSLKASNTQIQNFAGASCIPRLYSINMENTPVANEKYFRLMCVCVFGQNLSIINGSLVSNKTKELAKRYEKIVSPLLKEGFLIKKLNPLQGTLPGHKGMVVFDYENSNDLVDKQKSIEDKEKQIKELEEKIKKRKEQKNEEEKKASETYNKKNEQINNNSNTLRKLNDGKKAKTSKIEKKKKRKINESGALSCTNKSEKINLTGINESTNYDKDNSLINQDKKCKQHDESSLYKDQSIKVYKNDKDTSRRDDEDEIKVSNINESSILCDPSKEEKKVRIAYDNSNLMKHAVKRREIGMLKNRETSSDEELRKSLDEIELWIENENKNDAISLIVNDIELAIRSKSYYSGMLTAPL